MGTIATRRRSRIKTVNAFTARTHLGRLIKQVSEAGETYILTKKGKPKVVITAVEAYRDLLEIRAEREDKAFQKALKESAAQIKRGEVSSLAALRAIYRGR